MAKRRTKKQKKKAKHPFLKAKSTIRKDVTKKAKKAKVKHAVKGQSRKSASDKSPIDIKAKKAINMAEYENLRLIKKHLMKSLSLAALILSLEIVIYLVRQG
jgi:hypothetical protein